MTLSQPEPDGSSNLRDLLCNCLISNYENKEFLGAAAVKKQLTRERTFSWIKTHPLHRPSDNGIRDLDYVDDILNNACLLFATLVVVELEHLMFAALSKGFHDGSLPEIDWKVLNMSVDEQNKLGKYPGISSLVLGKRHYPHLTQQTVLPFKKRVQMEQFGAHGTIFSIEIADGHLEGYDNKSRVAEKRIRLERVSDEQTLLRELDTLQKRKHPSIVPLLASYILTQKRSEIPVRSLHLIFPWAETDLDKWMNDSGPPAGMQNLDKPQRRDILYRYIYGLVSCLSSLHRGYDGTFTSHHDLKPENILVIEEELKIADFGQSHLRSLTQGSETEAPHVGTYEYQPPEYWKNDGSRSILKHGRAFDIWSMGCICIELATLIVYGWESSMITEFRNQRRRNPTKNNPILAFKRAPDDSFHNNRDAVTRWINQLQLVDASEKLKSTLNVVRQMIAETPQERLYAWEAELDLYNIQRPDDDRVRRLEKGTHCIQGPQRKIFRNGIRTPLHRAAQNGDPDRIIQLFEAGWSLYVQDHEGKTALNVYEETQHRDLYKNLCERLVSKPSEEEIDERIILAAREGRVNEILDLLKQRISPMSTDEHGHSALFKAVEHGQASVIDCLLQAELANSKELVRQKENQWQDTPLHRAAFKGRPDIMKQVLKFLPDIEDQQKEGKTALFVAADWDHPEVAQLLLDKGAQLFTLNKSKETPLHEAARSGRIKVLQMLLNADDLGKCLEHRSSWGETPLWLAVHHNHPHLAQILIEKGASVHVTNFDGISLLERVVKLNLLGFWDTNSQLFARRDVENRNRSGRTPLDIAQDEKRLTFVPILKDLLLKN